MLEFSVNTNTAALGSLSALSNTTTQMNNDIEQLSTGYSINSPGDNPSGEAIVQTMTAQINGLNAAQQNAQNGLSVLQTAAGALSTVSNILQTLNTLAVTAANTATQSSSDEALIQSQVTQLTAELDRIASTVNFNGLNLLDGSYTGVGSFTGGEVLQVSNDSANVSTANQILFSLTGVSSSSLGLSGLNVNDYATGGNASSAIQLINSAISTVATETGQIGALMDRLNYTISNLGNEVQNTTASRGTIQDVNMASAMSQYTQLQILQQSGTAMLAQANQAPSVLLKLIG